MSTEIIENPGFTTPLRAMFGLVAVATLVSSSPWEHADPLTAATAYAGSLMWGVMAAFDQRQPWQRHVTMAVAIGYLVLVVCKVAGAAT